MLKRRSINNKLNSKLSLSLSIADVMYPVECSIRLYGVFYFDSVRTLSLSSNNSQRTSQYKNLMINYKTC